MTIHESSIRLLLVAPYINPDATGEAWSTWKWTDGIARHYHTTILTTSYPNQTQPSVLFPSARVLAMPGRLHRPRYAPWSFSAKLDYPRFFSFARRTLSSLQSAGEVWDLAHQLSPLALRYPSPLANVGIPYVLGPLAGSVPNPPGFLAELRQSEPMYMRLRDFDSIRFKYDPLLRSTLLNCSALIAVAPYVLDALPFDIPAPTYFESETGMREGQRMTPRGQVEFADDTLRLLYVGRITRSKGCRDLIRSLPTILPHRAAHLDVVGEGADLSRCKQEALRLGVNESVTFHGRQPHSVVMQHYADADLFVFPSFREPSGNVVFEAMGAGLPMVVASTGGPGYAVTNDCGITVTPTTPDEYSLAIAAAVLSISSDRRLTQAYSDSAKRRAIELGRWSDKLTRLHAIYGDVLNA